MSTATIEKPQRAAGNDDNLYEVYFGKRVALPPMSMLASWIASCLHGFLWQFVRARQLGRSVCEGLFILDAARDLRRRPDVAFVSAQRFPLHQPLAASGDWPVVPDLAVEVVSPTDVYREVLHKIGEYFRYGVAEVWVIQPEERQVYVYSSPTQVRILTAPQDLEGGQLLPGFRLSLADLFQEMEAKGEVGQALQEGI